MLAGTRTWRRGVQAEFATKFRPTTLCGQGRGRGMWGSAMVGVSGLWYRRMVISARVAHVDSLSHRRHGMSRQPWGIAILLRDIEKWFLLYDFWAICFKGVFESIPFLRQNGIFEYNINLIFHFWGYYFRIPSKLKGIHYFEFDWE